MNYTQLSLFAQGSNIVFVNPAENNYLKLPSSLCGFENTYTTTEQTISERTAFCFHGNLREDGYEYSCPLCGNKMHIHGSYHTTLRHLPFGDSYSCISFEKHRFYCPNCEHTYMQPVDFKAKNHNITICLERYAKDLLAYGFTNKEVSDLTGLGKNTVKDIDLQRLQEKYTIDGKKLIKPEKTTRYLGIDEFKLHNGYKYATLIVDMETGHILWLAHGKKKACVYEFVKHVGMEWMDHVEAVACDMNSDFQEAFEEICEHIQPVFDYFHIVKNLNEMVIGKIRKEEYQRLLSQHKYAEARSLKKSKFILTSSKETLVRKDNEAEEGKILQKGSRLFNTEAVVRKSGYVERYKELISQNKLLFTADLIKEKLSLAYKCTTEPEMANEISEIIDICRAAKNPHMRWFAGILDKYFEGIIAHATYRISSGRIEGINNKIKTLRRQGYGYPDDEYFFLKLFDISRKPYVRNSKSHKICD